eukprot:scaffold1581_cov43-Attheya_sp.AAC.1
MATMVNKKSNVETKTTLNYAQYEPISASVDGVNNVAQLPHKNPSPSSGKGRLQNNGSKRTRTMDMPFHPSGGMRYSLQPTQR